MSSIPENEEQLYLRYLTAVAKAASGTPLGKDDITNCTTANVVEQAAAAPPGAIHGTTRKKPDAREEFARELREMVAP